MKLKDGSITILFDRDRGCEIEVRDNEASIVFAKIKLDTEQVCSALSRLSNTPCEIEVIGLDKVGLKMENKFFVFEMPEYNYSNRDEIAKEEIVKVCPEGWIPDKYFGSQDSFFTQDGKKYARCIIRRWVKED